MIVLLAVTLLVATIGVTVVIASLHQTQRDRSSTNAFEAADAAVDIVAWRMNKQLVASEVSDLGGLTSELLGTVGCLDASVIVIDLDLQGECAEVPITGLANGATADCTTSLNASVLGAVGSGGTIDASQLPIVGGDRVLSRDIVCTSEGGDGVVRRVWARLDLPLEQLSATLASPTRLWTRGPWAECSSNEASPCPPV